MRILCRSCEAMAINGVPCHESGCPDSDQRWKPKGRGDNRRLMPENQELPDYLQPKRKVTHGNV